MVDQVEKPDQTRVYGQRPPLERGIDLSENARTVLEKRYLRKGPDGKPVETIEEMFWRVAWHVAEPEEAHGQDRQAVAEQFYDLLTSKRFFPNSPTFTGAGTPLGQLAACFVLAIADDMGREEEGIFQTLRNAALIQQTGGGNGFSFSRLRPKGARVSSSNGEATGPVGFLRVYDQAFGEIAQGGCLVPDTLVMTDRGLLRLDEIVTHREPGTWDEHELRVATDEGWRRSGASYNNGVARVLRVTTDAGLELTGTPNHKVKVMTDSGPEWRALEDLQPGDAILVKLGQYMPTSASQELPFPTEQHKKLDNDLALELGRAVGGAQVDGAIRELLVRNRLLTGSRMTEVPRAIRCSPRYVVDAFLRGLYEARQVPGLPGVDSLDPAFAKQVAILLIGLGYPAAIEVRDGAATVKIVEKETVPDFSGPSILDYHDSPFGVVCPQCAVDDLWFVTVEAVEDAGEAPTLDLEVDGNHTYLANGLVTHNSRRGANMGVLRVDHPDIEEFITAKAEEGQIENFNISVAVTDAFMQAVKEDKDFDLINPQDGTVWRTVRARDLFNKIVKYAHHNGEPGMLFIDAANRDNPVPHLYELEATNPCGEQWLGPFENCCLGSVNLAQHVTPEGQVDWEKLRETVELSTRFLDDVVDANKYVPAVPQLEVAAHRVRRIGLGIMGLSDLMYRLGVRYGSDEGQEFAAQIMEFVHYHCMRTSVELSRDRGPFLAIRGSRFDPDDLKWEPPTPLKPYKRDWGRPSLDWQAIVEGIKRHGIRNGAHTTIAPTGTISTVAGVEGYGCEPVFALAYVRYFDDKGTRRKLQYTSPLFQQALIDAGLDEATRQRIIEQVNATGSCQNVPEVPDEIKRVFVVASDITAEEHVLMQAVLQRFVSNSISKTCNFPSTATEKDVADAFMQAWELGCKGLTVYVAGTREKVVLETAETARKRQSQETAEQTAPAASTAPAAEPASDAELPLFGPEKKKPRARVLPGWTYRLETPLGTMFVTVNENGESEPFEVFMHTSKAGSETAAVSEAMGRLISYILRLRSPVPLHERLKEVVRQLEGIGGGRSLGLGPNRVRSLPDGIAQVLMDYLADRKERAEQGNLHARNHEQAEARPASTPAATGQMAFKFGDLCPECGQAAVVNEEGCRKCYACGYSEC